jgi:hypothetical protein
MKEETMKKVMKRSPRKGTTALVVKDAGLPAKAADGVRAITAVDPQALLAQAIDKGMPVESMERLLAMRREMKAEYAREQYFKALSGFQRECPIVYKTKKVMGKAKDGKPAEKKYSYAPFEDILAFREGPQEPSIKELLNKWQFSYTFKSRQEEKKYISICIAHHQDGHEEATEFMVPTDFPEYMNMSGAQEQGASCTYADRYAFKNAFGIVTKGDDTDAVRPDDDNRRTPIRQPQEHTDAAVPVQHQEVKPLSDYDRGLRYLAATETDPRSKQMVALFTDNEKIDYTHELGQAKGNTEAMAKILADIVTTGKTRRTAVKGE